VISASNEPSVSKALQEYSLDQNRKLEVEKWNRQMKNRCTFTSQMTE
jgi:hypothetical protein